MVGLSDCGFVDQNPVRSSARHTYLAQRIPWSIRWFLQYEALPLHFGWADRCDRPKCGRLGCAIFVSGGLRSRYPLIIPLSLYFWFSMHLLWCVILCCNVCSMWSCHNLCSVVFVQLMLVGDCVRTIPCLCFNVSGGLRPHYPLFVL